MQLRGPRLTLRLPEPADAPALFALATDPEVVQFFSWGPYRSVDEPRAWIAAQAARRESGEALALLIDLHEGGVAGVIELAEHAVRDRRAVVGTWLGRAHWGTQTNAEAKRLLFALAFGHLGLARLGAYADVHHTRSQRALEKVGFQREGTLRSFHRHADVAKDVHVYGLLREEWAAAGPEVPPLTGVAPAAFLPAS